MKRIVSILLILLLTLGVWVLPAAASTEYKTWLQSDSRWGSITFGNAGDTISKSGCAITAVAKLMVHSGSVSSDPTVFNPGIFCNWLKSNGGFTTQGWLIWSAISGYTSKFSYSGAATLSGTAAQKTATISSYINDGYVVVAMVKYGGHYVAISHVENGTAYIMDSANTGYTKLFQYEAAGVEKLQIFKGVTTGNNSDQTNETYDTTVQDVGVGVYTITSSDGVNLRSGPGTSNGILTAIPYNTAVTVTKVSNGWGYTTYSGQKGWFSLEFAKLQNALRGLSITPPDKLEYQVGDNPVTTGMSVTALYADGSSKVLTSGFSMKGFTTDAPGKYTVYIVYQTKAASFTITVTKAYTTGWYVITSDDGVNLRADATTNSDKLSAIPYNIRLQVTQVKNNWGKVTYNGQTGWICLDYAKLTEAAANQTGISVTPQSSCILAGSSLTKSFFTVKQVFDDNSFIITQDFTMSMGAITDGALPITINQGDFSQTVTLQVFDAIPKGDCNFDGKANAGDALYILRHAVEKENDVFYEEVADVNGDGKIDAVDALQVLKFAVGKLESL